MVIWATFLGNGVFLAYAKPLDAEILNSLQIPDLGFEGAVLPIFRKHILSGSYWYYIDFQVSSMHQPVIWDREILSQRTRFDYIVIQIWACACINDVHTILLMVIDIVIPLLFYIKYNNETMRSKFQLFNHPHVSPGSFLKAMAVSTLESKELP